MNIELIHKDLVHKLKNFFADSACGKAIVSLSGGLDSAVVTALAAQAIGAKNVRAIMLPSRFSSAGSVDHSIELCKRIGVNYDVVDIEPVFEAAIATLNPMFNPFEMGNTAENMQSRIRCMLTMAAANANGALMLNTSNRSEILVGYGTLYGDMGGAVGVIASLYKSEVYNLARAINAGAEQELIPNEIIDKIPSAELRDNQKDSDTLPDYPVLDDILHRMVDLGQSVVKLSKDYPEHIVRHVEALHRNSAFKRMQLPPAL